MSLIGSDNWFLEIWAQEPITQNKVEVRDVDPEIPSAFQESVDEEYLADLTDMMDKVNPEAERELEIDGDKYKESEIEISGGELELDGEVLEPNNWSERPTLWAVYEDGEREKIFWDGATSVFNPHTESDKLVLEGYRGSYAERQAAQNAVEEYDTESLPLSTNISVGHLLDFDAKPGAFEYVSNEAEPVLPLFKRSSDVSEYPETYHVVAGGIPDIDMPVDAGWMESFEEIRVLPNAGSPEEAEDELTGRRIIPEEASLREGRIGGNHAYVINQGNDAMKIYPTIDNEIKVMGIARNTETHAPEILGSVEAELPYSIVRDNYVRGAEHSEIVPVSVDKIDEFTRENEVIPVGEALMRLVENQYGLNSMENFQIEPEKPYEDFETEVM